MASAQEAGDIRDISGQPDTNVGNMLSRIRTGMSELDKSDEADIRITDILAVDTLAPVLISGALAGETCLEKAVGIAAMVKTQKLPMQEIAARLTTELGTDVKVAGVEAVMASLGALTTPGTKLPLAILDMGGGSTDAAIINESGHVNLTHQAGAGELVSMLIQTELGLSDRHIAEEIKKYPLAKVESLFHMRMENGQMTFVDESIDPRFFGRVVLLTENGLIRIEEEIPMEKIVQVRREAKRKVFVTNAFRALKKVAPDHNLRNISTVVLVGGSAEDFEIPEMLMEAFTDYRIVCGRGNIRGTEGPRNAVATGRKYPRHRRSAKRRRHRAGALLYRRNGGLNLIIKRPSIFIYTHEADPAVLKEVCAGIEEEGVFYDTTEMPDECMEKLAYKAARDSMLGSGVGIFGTAVCLKMRGLEKGRNIESYLTPNRAQCRNIGANSARAIKKLPFKEEYRL